MLILVNNSFSTPRSANALFLFKILNPLEATKSHKNCYILINSKQKFNYYNSVVVVRDLKILGYNEATDE